MASEPQASAHVDRPRYLRDQVFTTRFLYRAGIVLLLALYLRSLTFDFVYDDLRLQVSPWIQSWHGIVEAFRNDIFGDAGAVESSYYRPLPICLVVLVARLAAPTPQFYHLMAVLIAVVVYALTYQVGRLLFKDDTLAALTTVLYALHPTKIETVAWIGSAACDGLSGVFFFGLLICYLKWWETRDRRWFSGALLLFLCAMFTKETMVVVPVLVAVHCLLRSESGGRLKQTALVVASFLGPVGIYWAARHAALRSLPKTSTAIKAAFSAENVWTAPLAFWWYVKQTMLPLHVAVLHDWTTIPRPSFVLFVMPLMAGILLFAALGWLWWRTRAWQIPFFAAWFVLTIAPAVAMAPKVLVHDRYLLLAVYPFCALVAYGLMWAYRQRQSRMVAVVVGVVVVGLWAGVTWYQMGAWDNSLSLWQRAVQVAPHSVNARVELARIYSGSNLPAAIGVLDDGLRLLPNSPGLWRMRGSLQFNGGQLDEARLSFLHALEASRRFENDRDEPPDVKYGRATAAFFLGEIEMQKNNPTAADAWLRMALAIKPGDPDFRKVMGTNLRKLGREQEAAQYDPATSGTATKS